jgi:hypothetical protein
MESKKNLVTKIVGHGKMHISAKNGVNIQKFAMELAQTMVNWVESQVKSRLVLFFVKSFLWNSGLQCSVFFLGTTSHIMTPCIGFSFFF